jgi:alpha-tubulin suppressor-like RCC1 family protein
VIGVSVGALHCLAVTDAGQVFAWGVSFSLFFYIEELNNYFPVSG